MDKFINPFTDYGWKAIFGTELNKDVIISFLNSLISNETITDLTFRNVESLGMRRDARKAVFDIFCQNDKGEFIIIEMQQAWQEYFTDRVLFYASFPIQQQSLLQEEYRKKGSDSNEVEEAEQKKVKWNYNIRKVYVICMLNFIMDKTHPEKYRWDVVRMDRELKTPFSETLNEIYLEMPKFKLSLKECDTFYKKWLYVLNNIEIMERLPEELNNQIFRKLKSIVEIERMSLDERLEYEQSLSAYRDFQNITESLYKKGKEEGLSEGEAKGKVEEKQNIASEMKKNGLSVALISRITHLSEEEITAL